MPFEKGNKLSTGRPKAKHTIAAEAKKKLLVSLFLPRAAVIFKRWIEDAENGDQMARRDLMDRIWGKEAQPLSGEFNFTSDVPDEIYKGILSRESQRTSVKVSGD